MALQDIIDIGRCADNGAHQAEVGVHPICAFMPKCHRLPFLVWCISGSRSPVLFLVELGAAISVASTAVPVLSIRPLAIKVALIVTSN